MGYWPSYTPVDVKLPEEVCFKPYYISLKHNCFKTDAQVERNFQKFLSK